MHLFATRWFYGERIYCGAHPSTMDTMADLGQLYENEGKYAKAEPLYAKALEVRRRVLGENHPDSATVRASMGKLRLQQKRFAESSEFFRGALHSFESTIPDSWERYESQSLLGASLDGQKQYPEAEGLLLSGYQGMLQREATIPAAYRREVEQTSKWVVQLYQDWGKLEQAAEWRQRFQVPTATAASPKR